MKNTTSFAVRALLVAAIFTFFHGSQAQAQIITGAVVAAPSTVNLNSFTTWADYGNATPFGTAVTDVGNTGTFSNITFVSGDANGVGNDSIILITYTGGSITPSSSTNSPNFDFAQDQGTTLGKLSLTTTLFASTETLSLYLSNYDTTSDFSVNGSGGGTFSLTNLVLPTSSDGDGTGFGHTYGVLQLNITGTVGQVITVTDTTNLTGVTGGANYSGVGINAISAVPEPSSVFLMGLGLAALLVVQRKRQEKCFKL